MRRQWTRPMITSSSLEHAKGSAIRPALSFIIFVFSIASCTGDADLGKATPPEHQSLDTSTGAETTDTADRQFTSAGTGGERQALRCSPRSLRPADTLTLSMNVPHGSYLVVVDPTGTMFYLVHPFAANPPTHGPSLVSGERFRVMTSYRVPASVRAKPFVYGRDAIEPVFTREGAYRVQMGESMSTDFGSPPAECIVGYRR